MLFFSFHGHLVKSSLEPLTELFVNHQLYLKNERSIVSMSPYMDMLCLHPPPNSNYINQSIHLCLARVYLIVYLHIIWLTLLASTSIMEEFWRLLFIYFYFFIWQSCSPLSFSHANSVIFHIVFIIITVFINIRILFSHLYSYNFFQ